MIKNEKQYYIINKFLKQRSDIFTSIVYVIITALILSLFANSLTIVFVNKAKLICFGSFIFLLIFLICFFIYKIFPLLDQEMKYEGKFFFNENTKKVVSIKDYLFSQKMQEYFEGLFAEDKSIYQKWKKGSLNGNYFTKNFELIGEAVEFYLISDLSGVLLDYFEDKSKGTNNIKHYKRKQLLSMFGENRFFKLFTKNIKKRKAFKNGYEFGFGKNRKLYQATAFDKSYYEFVDLVLPKNVNISNDKKDKGVFIKIKTPQLELTIWSCIYIDTSFAPSDLLMYSSELFMNDYENINALDVDIKVQVKFNRWRTLFSLNFDEYVWVDSLTKALEKYFDINYFEQRKLPEKVNKYIFEKLIDIEREIKRKRYPITPEKKSYVYE